MIRQCTPQDTPRIYTIINDAARAYQGHIPEDCYHDPYMPLEELEREMAQMTFFGWEEQGELVGVVGYQPVRDVTLIRHAYVLTPWQRRGIGSRLLEHLKAITQTRRLLVGTWSGATWAIAFYQKHGFRLEPHKDELLLAYWDVPSRQREVSVVLGLEVEGR